MDGIVVNPQQERRVAPQQLSHDRPSLFPDPSTPIAHRATAFSPVFPLVVAITDDAAAEAAIRMADTLARELGAVPTLVHVDHGAQRPMVGETGAMGFVDEASLTPEFRNRRMLALENQVRASLGTLPAWHYYLETGAAVPTIVERVKSTFAELLVLGLPHHTFLQRTFARDTVQGVAEQTGTAVFAVRPTLTHRPRSILVALDFGVTSRRAALMACELVSPGGQIVLAYVQPEGPEFGANGSERAARHNRDALEAALASMVDELSARTTASVISVIEEGNPVHGVERAAHRLHPDVIALGARHHTSVDWFFGDSVSTELASERAWSLLFVP